ncbi:MAG: gamma-glutamyltransferase [Myxococcaceae bacterium]|nr:gamma-glutamyltransferase [Myxococcaceae bacterium]
MALPPQLSEKNRWPRQSVTALKITCALLVFTTATAVASPPYRQGAIAAAHPAASAAGKAMLDKKGNAVDAAVAAAFVMAVVGPYHSGLGGGGFAVVHDAQTQNDTAFDFREVAPSQATADMYLRNGKVEPALATDGALAIAVPGAVAGYLGLHAKYGKLPRATVLAPAIAAATQGFRVTPKYADLATLRLGCLRTDAEASRIFLQRGPDETFHVPPLGTVLKQPELAKTLRALATLGPRAFYAGRVAQAIERSVKEKGGILTRADLKAYQPQWRAPLLGNYRGHRVVTMPPPSAGGLTVVQTLGVLERVPSEALANRSPAAMHTFIETLRRSYAYRASTVADPAFVSLPLEKLTSAEYFADIAKRIDPKRATPSSTLAVKPSAPESPDKHTTHISVVDAQGNAVALTTTLNYYFGSCVMAKGTGVLLNDEMDDFAAQPGAPNIYGLVAGTANGIAPGKIPVSSMSPTLVFQKDRPQEVMLAVGSPGGSTIPTTVLNVITNVIDGQLDVQQAVARARIHHQYQPDVVQLEPMALDEATQNALTALGHTFKSVEKWGDAEAVLVHPTTGLKTAASDPRNEGAAAGQE